MVVSSSTVTESQQATLHLTAPGLQEDAGSFDFSEKTIERTSEEERQYRKETLAAGFRSVERLLRGINETDKIGSLQNTRLVSVLLATLP